MQIILQNNQIVNVVEPTTIVSGEGTASFTTHYIGETKFPLKTSSKSSVFIAHYPGAEPFSGAPEKLSFKQMGSFEIPDLEPYVNSCDTLEFSGRILKTRNVFEIAHKLKNVSSVSIFIDSSQADYTDKPDNYKCKSPLCKNVESLKITMDLDYYCSNFEHKCKGNELFCNGNPKCLSKVQKSLILFFESLLRHAGESFPNLKNLTVDVPENARLNYAVKSVINVCNNLKGRTSVYKVLPSSKSTLQLYPADDLKCSPGYGHSTMISNRTSARKIPVVPRVFPHQKLPLHSLPPAASNNIYIKNIPSGIQQVIPPPRNQPVLLLVPIQANNVINCQQPRVGFSLPPLPTYYPINQNNMQFR